MSTEGRETGEKSTPASKERSIANAKLEALLRYCQEKTLKILPSLRPQFSSISGLGLHAVKKIKAGQQLVHTPLSCLLTTTSVPTAFLPDLELRRNLTVHGLLAAWLSLGDQDELCRRYGAWMEVWPSWTSFREGLPVFWGFEDLLSIVDDKVGHITRPIDDSKNGIKRRKVAGQGRVDATSDSHETSGSKTAFTLSPAISGRCLALLSHTKTHNTKEAGLLLAQATKIRRIIQLLHRNASLVGFDILAPDRHGQLIRFLHMWACVNTRCFYYLPPNTSAPSDPNEAMALVPFQDLFNHSTLHEGCKTKFDKKGFWVYADRDYNAGEEVFIHYGKHSDDALWVEYGFTLDPPPDQTKPLSPLNQDDTIPLDPIIVPCLSKSQQTLLDEKGYLGLYSLTQSGICYRTEVAAWLVSGAISQSNWEAMLEGTFDPERKGLKIYQVLKQKVMRVVVDWLTTIRAECAHNIGALLKIGTNPHATVQAFMPNRSLLDPSEREDEPRVLELAKSRSEMCLRRWKGIYEMYQRAVRAIEHDCPGSFVDGSKERTEKILLMSTEEFIRTLVVG